MWISGKTKGKTAYPHVDRLFTIMLNLLTLSPMQKKEKELRNERIFIFLTENLILLLDFVVESQFVKALIFFHEHE